MTDTSPAPQYLEVNGSRIAYHHHAGDGAGVMFLGGFKSDMQGGKATMLEGFCRARNIPFTRMDYGGHGESDGKFEDGTIGEWLSHAAAIFDHTTSGQTVVVGSSMGGWMMLLLALSRPKEVAGLVGIASAPDFTENLIWKEFTEAQQQEMADNGCVMLPNCMPGESDYPITRQLIEEGRSHLLLGSTVNIHCPTHLLHGMQDPDVPWQLSVELAEKMARRDVAITLVKDGDHRMSTPANLALLCQTVENMVAQTEKNSAGTQHI